MDILLLFKTFQYTIWQLPGWWSLLFCLSQSLQNLGSQTLFPLEWLQCNQVGLPQLLPYESLYSDLKQNNVLEIRDTDDDDEDTVTEIWKTWYQQRQYIWLQQRMSSFKDFFHLLQQFGCRTFCLRRGENAAVSFWIQNQFVRSVCICHRHCSMVVVSNSA